MTTRLTAPSRSTTARHRAPLLERDAELLSMDVFGVALDRLVIRPDDVHRLVAAPFVRRGHRIGSRYPELRQRAEVLARDRSRAAGGAGAIGLADIGDQLVELLTPLVGDARDVARQAIEREVALERQLSRPSPDAAALVAEAGRRRVPVAFVADTYLPRDLVALLLRSAGLPSGIVLVSSHEGVTKADGRLFRHLAERTGVRPERITHIGPDQTIDVGIAGAVGLRGHHLAPARTAAAGLLHLGLNPASALDSVGLALAAQRLAPVCCGLDPANAGPGREAGDPAADLGYYAGGPLGAGFAAWVGQIVDRERPDAVLFAGPAGPVLSRLVRALRPDLPSNRLVELPDADRLELRQAVLSGLPGSGAERRMLVVGLGWPDQPHHRLARDLDLNGHTSRISAAYLGLDPGRPGTRDRAMGWAFAPGVDTRAAGLADDGRDVLGSLLAPDPRAGAEGRRPTATAQALTAGAVQFARQFGPWLGSHLDQTTTALAEPALRLVERPTPAESRILRQAGRPPVRGDLDGAGTANGRAEPARVTSALVGLLRRRDLGR